MATLTTKKRAVSKALKDWTRDKCTQFTLARDVHGVGINNPKSKEAVKWCAFGRLILVSSQETANEIDKDFRSRYTNYLYQINDYQVYDAVVKQLKELYSEVN